LRPPDSLTFVLHRGLGVERAGAWALHRSRLPSFHSATLMPDYAVCGGSLRSSVVFPELQRTRTDRPTWSFDVRGADPPRAETELLGEEAIYGDVHARLYRWSAGYRIVVDDTGTFDLSDDGATIEAYPLDTAWPDFLRAHLVGRVLATALHLSGILTLHGSAVALGDAAVAFLAPKHYGKSTLALGLVRAGATLMSDDALPIEAGAPPMARPGVHSLRLRSDSAALLAGPGPRPASRDGKELVTDVPIHLRREAPAPLRAVYLLTPAATITGGMAALRRPLAPVEAAVGLVAHAKIGSMLGAWGAPVVLRQAVELVRSVPVYTLAVLRELPSLPDVVRTILEWHGGRYDVAPRDASPA